MAYNKNRKSWKVNNPKGLDTTEFSDPHRKYENHIFIVYMHTNKINGKVYIGITHHINPNKRWGYAGQKYKRSKLFERAIKKYGWENFTHIILCRTNKEKAITLEKALITHYKYRNISYNIANGGEGSDAVSEETKAKLKKIKSAKPAMLGKHHTEEAKAKIAEAGRGRVMKESIKERLREKVWSDMSYLRKSWTKETYKKIGRALSKAVIQMDINGNIIREYSSTVEAELSISSKKRQNHIADVCNGKRNTAHGFKWMYK